MAVLWFRLWPACPVVVFTAFDLSRETALEAGAYDLLTKQGGVQELAGVVERLRRGSARLPTLRQ